MPQVRKEIQLQGWQVSRERASISLMQVSASRPLQPIIRKIIRFQPQKGDVPCLYRICCGT